MSSIRNPVGPEEPSTYWRRRALVIVALLVVVLLVWWLVQSAFGSDAEPEAQVAPSASPSWGLSLPASGDPRASDEPSSASSPPSPQAGTTAPAKVAKCADSDVEVAVRTDSGTVAVGDGLALSMTVQNSGGQPCRRNVGPGANEIRIESGTALVWSSDFCSPSTEKDNQVLEPDEDFSASVTWTGRVTQEGCPDEQPVAQPGSYRAIARNLGVESEPVAFTVR